MAGSYRHVTDKNNNLVSNEEFIDHIENLGDAYETIEEMWHMIDILTGGDKEKIRKVHIEYIKRVGVMLNMLKNQISGFNPNN